MSAAHDSVAAFLALQVEVGTLPGASWWVEELAHPVSAGAVGCSIVVPHREAAAPDTPYDLASLTKPLATAILAVLLEQDGRLDLDAPVGDLLPEVCGSPYESASFLHLGAHRAGLPAWRPLYLEAATLPDYLRAIARRPPAAPRGKTLYTDLGYLLLGAAVERAAGTPLDRLFDLRIAGPLGLRATGYAAETQRFAAAAATETGNAHERSMAGPAGAGYRWRTEVVRGQVHDGNAHALGGVAGHAGLFGTAAEVSAIAREILRPGVLALGDRARRRLCSPVAEEGSRTFGLVLARDSEAARGVLPEQAPGHTGFTGTSIWLDPVRQRVFVLLTNRVHPVVPARDFQPVRRGFHQAARAVLRSRSIAPEARGSSAG